MNIKTPFCSTSQGSFTVGSAFPGRRSQQDHVGCWWNLKVKSLFMRTALSISQGMGPGALLTPLPLHLWTIGWTHGFFLLFHQQVALKPAAFVFKKSPISPRAQVGTEWTPPGSCLVSSQSLFPDCSEEWQGCTGWRNKPGSHLPFARYQEISAENKSMT